MFIHGLNVISNIIFIIPIIWILKRVQSIKYYLQLQLNSINDAPDIESNDIILISSNIQPNTFLKISSLCYLSFFLSLIGLIVCSSYYHYMIYLGYPRDKYIWIDWSGITVCVCCGMILLLGIFTPIHKVILEMFIFILQFVLGYTRNYMALVILPGFLIVCVILKVITYFVLFFTKANVNIKIDIIDAGVSVVSWIIALSVFQFSNYLHDINDDVNFEIFHSLWHVLVAIAITITAGISNKNVNVLRCNFEDIDKISGTELYYIKAVINNNYNYN